MTGQTPLPPPTSTPRQLDEHEPRGTPDEAQTITAGLSPGSLGQTIALPQPRLVHDFRLRARLEGKVALGQSCWGERNWIGICGGEWSATWGHGTIVVRFLPMIPHVYPLIVQSRPKLEYCEIYCMLFLLTRMGFYKNFSLVDKMRSS